jgi:type II restriction/modification system DNA methylase subunit YeeA
MTPEQFISKWHNATLKERSAAQEHFLDLCRLLDQPTPAEADPKGEWFAFEYGAKKAGGGDGWADVWRRNCFGWEYKGKGKDLQAAFKQLQLYTPALEYPPLLIVCDIETIVIHTAFTGTVPETHVLTLDDLLDQANRLKLKYAFTEPERLKPSQGTDALTEAAARRFGELAQALRGRGHAPQQVAHFLDRLLFCMFAEDVDLLPRNLFTRTLESLRKNPIHADAILGSLFQAMAKGGLFGPDFIEHFNGGLFEDERALPLTPDDLKTLLGLARLDWSAIQPSIFGTLFERGLDPDKRSQLGAHYTDPASIMRLIRPVILQPLQAEWSEAKAIIEKDKTKTRKKAQAAYQGFLERLKNYRILDPACGSGNFLYLALRALKDLEHQVILEAEALGLPRGFPQVGPECVMGIELNPYAAELARVTVWIGEIQWMLAHGFNANRNPILKPLDNIQQRDAVLNGDGSEPEWPEADSIVGNPPFLGDKKMLAELGGEYVTRLRKLYKGRVPGGADLVTYWFEKARAQIEAGKTKRAGLVSTNSIRGGASRKVLERIRETGRIFNAWSDEPWVNEGAAVRVSLVSFSLGENEKVLLDDQEVSEIYADLSAGEDSQQTVDATMAIKLDQNRNIAFIGTQKNGPFEVPGDQARAWIDMPTNPNGNKNSGVVKRWINGMDVSRRNSDKWIIDFGVSMSEEDAALYEAPFQYVLENVKPGRANLRREGHRKYWWRYGETRRGMREAIEALSRYIATPRVAKHRLFVWVPKLVIPDSRLTVIARSDDEFFGMLNSSIHAAWTLATCSWHGAGNDPTYNAQSVFETFPFPEGLTPDLEPEAYTNPQAEAIAEAARNLNQLRENWLNPPEWIERVPEVVAGYPDRIIPKPEHEKELKKRTLTNLYNQRPAWLDNAHRKLDEAVAAAYGWEADIPDEEVLRRLLALNLERAGKIT